MLHSWLGKLHTMPQYTTGLGPPPATSMTSWFPPLRFIYLNLDIVAHLALEVNLDETYFVVTLVADKIFDNLIQCINPFNDTVQYWNLFTNECVNEIPSTKL